jgi:translocation and assembly module TamB
LLGGFTHDLTSKIGIDVVRVDQGSYGPRLEIGKYLGERLYVGYRRLIGSGGDDRNANELRLEYRLTPRIVVESGFGDAGIGGLDLMWSYRY